MTHIDTQARASAAGLLLDAIGTFSLADAGTQAADDRIVLAMGTLGLDLGAFPEFRPVVAAALDLLTLLLQHQADRRGVSLQQVARVVKTDLLPAIYPDVLPGS
ncbi:hypothetical protein HNR19_000310 [Nocardioides thalensis]|uniref:Uncharacterized protein n=1 Tax=Nocardioides thalensis TaxID=1914755 RepID=A0A853BYP8_9ACTN|nr:hypothetical protein [Nocardioides thalensis]NYI99611.1 hypothetical protein [Nocardioides thalensis]